MALPRRILVVGDPVFARSLVRLVLARLDYVVECLDTAAEAEAVAARRRFAMFLIALTLPDGTGLDLATRLRARLGSEVPILLFGDAWNAERVEARCRELGLAGYLAKPVSIGRLIAVVRELTRPPGIPTAEADGMAAPADDIAAIRARLCEVADGDACLGQELAELFLATARRYLGELQEAAGDEARRQRIAHALAGAARNVHAHTLARLAGRLEAGEQVALAELEAVVRLLERELAPAAAPSGLRARSDAG